MVEEDLPSWSSSGEDRIYDRCRHDGGIPISVHAFANPEGEADLTPRISSRFTFPRANVRNGRIRRQVQRVIHEAAVVLVGGIGPVGNVRVGGRVGHCCLKVQWRSPCTSCQEKQPERQPEGATAAA